MAFVLTSVGVVDTPLRAALGAARQALLASPARGEVNSTLWLNFAPATAITLPFAGRFGELGL